MKVNTMQAIFATQTSKTKRHGSIAVMPVCLWSHRLVAGST
jgi:hypothetical protein